MCPSRGTLLGCKLNSFFFFFVSGGYETVMHAWQIHLDAEGLLPQMASGDLHVYIYLGLYFPCTSPRNNFHDALNVKTLAGICSVFACVCWKITIYWTECMCVHLRARVLPAGLGRGRFNSLIRDRLEGLPWKRMQRVSEPGVRCWWCACGPLWSAFSVLTPSPSARAQRTETFSDAGGLFSTPYNK